MTLIPLQNILFLTCGGNSPQLISWDCEINCFKKITYPQFNSVYTLSIDPGKMAIAAGTRNGLIYIHDLAQVEKKKLPLKKTLIQGSPILSLCWLDNGLLAVSDKAGRCIIWDIERKVILQSLETRKNVICSLVYKNNTLYGLAMNAKLFLWDLNNPKRFMNIKIPHVPKIGSLVNLVFWPANNTLVFPSSDGRLVFYNIDTRELSTIKAHAGNFYSISLCGKYLTSFGIEDHQFKIWYKNTNEPVLAFSITKTIISAVCFSNKQDRFLLTDSNGSAYEYLLEPRGLKLIQQLQGQDYRICISLSPGENRQLKKIYQKNKALEIADKILKCDGQISESDLKRHYNELTEIGYNHVRLTFQVNQAEESGDLFKAIELSLELLSIIPEDNNETCSSMEKHAILLEKTWNLAEACRIGKEILKIDSVNYCAKKIINTYECSGVNKDSWIIEPDISLEVVLKSAAVVKNINGRYVIKTLDHIVCEKIVLTAELIIKKHEEMQNTKDSNPLYKVTIESARFFSNKENKNIQILTFGSNNASQRVQFAARVIYSASGTIIIPIILFDCRYHYTKKTSGDNDVDIFAMFLRIKNCPSSSMYLRKIHKLFYHTLQRLITEKTARKKFNNDIS